MSSGKKIRQEVRRPPVYSDSGVALNFPPGRQFLPVYEGGTNTMEKKIDKSKTAIVLIEPQNDFLSPGGTMYAHIKEQLAERGVIDNLRNLLSKARGKVKIFYV